MLIKLRPHHLLCIQKFTGNGYDARFISRMNEMIRSLQKDPYAQVEIVKGGDMLCLSCPNYNESVCGSEEKVRSIDEKVLRICKMHYGKAGSWYRLSEDAAKIFQPGFFDTVCGACEWNQLCKNTERGILYERGPGSSR